MTKEEPAASHRVQESRTDRPQRTSRAAGMRSATTVIGRALQDHYADIVNAPIPGKFAELLKELEAREQEEKKVG